MFSKVVPERFIVIASEWNARAVIPPWRFDDDSPTSDSWWVVLTDVTLSAFSELVLNQRINPIKRNETVGAFRHYRVVSQIEMLAMLRLLGGSHVHKYCDSQARRTIDSVTHIGLKAEFAAHLNKLDEYVHYAIAKYFKDDFDKLTQSRQQNIDTRIEQLHTKSKTSPIIEIDLSSYEKPYYTYNTSCSTDRKIVSDSSVVSSIEKPYYTYNTSLSTEKEFTSPVIAPSIPIILPASIHFPFLLNKNGVPCPATSVYPSIGLTFSVLTT